MHMRSPELNPQIMLAGTEPISIPAVPGIEIKCFMNSVRSLFEEGQNNTVYFQEMIMVCDKLDYNPEIDSPKFYFKCFQAIRHEEEGVVFYARELGKGITEKFTPNASFDYSASGMEAAVIKYTDASGQTIDPEQATYLRIPFGAPEAPDFCPKKSNSK